MKLNTAKTFRLQEERDEAVEQAATVKDTIKSEVDQLEEEVSRELAAKDQEIMEFSSRNEELERHGERLEQKINFLIKENLELEAREDVGSGGMSNRTPRTARGGGGGGGHTYPHVRVSFVLCGCIWQEYLRQSNLNLQGSRFLV